MNTAVDSVFIKLLSPLLFFERTQFQRMIRSVGLAFEFYGKNHASHARFVLQQGDFDAMT